MRLLAVILAATTLIFAASTVYLARELHAARNAPVPDRAASTASATSATMTPSPDESASVPAKVSRGETANVAARVEPDSGTKSSSNTPRTVTHVVSSASPDPAAELAKLEDPAQRAQLLEERKNLYQSAYAGLPEYLGFDDYQYERFIEMIARHELEMQEAGLRCWLDTSCKSRGVGPDLMNAQRREISDEFGAQTMDSYRHFQHTQGERQMVKELRARLPDQYRLMDAQREPLVTALHEEQRRISSDIRRRGLHVSNFNNVIYTPEPGAAPDSEVSRATHEYNRMLRDRAATVLTPEQLAAYERMQTEALRSFQSMRIPSRASMSSEGN